MPNMLIDKQVFIEHAHMLVNPSQGERKYVLRFIPSAQLTVPKEVFDGVEVGREYAITLTDAPIKRKRSSATRRTTK
jgi:hypothetical protein